MNIWLKSSLMAIGASLFLVAGEHRLLAEPEGETEKEQEKGTSQEPESQSSAIDESLVTGPENTATMPSEASEAPESPPVKKVRKASKTQSENAVEADKPVPSSAVASPETPQIIPIPEGAEISQGERISIDGKGFTIVPPKSWIVQRNVPRVSLSLMAPVAVGQYPRNINVVRFGGSVLINDETAEKFSEKIVKDFPATSPTIENYTLRNNQRISMADGREGLLFYTDFTGTGRKMMQAHVLLSSETNHYLITYTDVAENFEAAGGNAASPALDEAWAGMTSIELDSPNPKPSQELTFVIGGLLGLSVAWFLFSFIRNRRAAIEYREFADRGHGSPDNDELMSSLAEVRVDQAVTLEPTLMSMPLSDAPNFNAEGDSGSSRYSETHSAVNSAMASSLGSGINSAVASGRKLKLGKRNTGASNFFDIDDLPSKAAEVSSIEFSQDKFKRGA